MNRKSLLAVALMVAVVGGFGGGFGAAHATDCGPGGTPVNGSGSCDTTANQVQCGPGTGVSGFVLSVGASGAEFCNAGTSLPVQGRVGAQQDCTCAYIDGDADNFHTGFIPLDGWVRVDQQGVHCAERKKANNQSYNSAPGSDVQNCFRVI